MNQAEARYKGGVRCLELYGPAYYSSISKGRKRFPRLSEKRKGGGAGRGTAAPKDTPR